MENKKEVETETRRKSLSFFFLFFPIVLLAVLSFIPNSNLSFGQAFILIIAKFLVIIFQYVAIKNFVESTI